MFRRAGLRTDIQPAELPVAVHRGHVVPQIFRQLRGRLRLERAAARLGLRLIRGLLAARDLRHQIRLRARAAARDAAHRPHKRQRVHLIGVLPDPGPREVACVRVLEIHGSGLDRDAVTF